MILKDPFVSDYAESACDDKNYEPYKSEYSAEKMKQIDNNVAKWMINKKKGGWKWLEAERMGNTKTKEFFNSIIK